MVYSDRIGKAGMITAFHLLIGDKNRKFGLGVYKETGTGSFKLVRQFLPHEHPNYQHILDSEGAIIVSSLFI